LTIVGGRSAREYDLFIQLLSKVQKMSSPIVEVNDKTVLLNTSIPASQLFTATDPTDTIVSYYVQDFSARASSGYFTFDGAAVSHGDFFEVAAADLDKLEYVAGSQVGSERFRVMARNASGRFSDPMAIGMLYSARANTTAPYARANSFTVLADEVMQGSEILWGYDPDGHPIVSFQVRDRSVDNGYFELDGVSMTQGTYFTVAAEDVDKLVYKSTGASSTELFDVMSFDGVDNSANHVGFANTQVNLNPPVVQYSTQSIGGNQCYLWSGKFRLSMQTRAR
jgi:hypothetical protein